MMRDLKYPILVFVFCLIVLVSAINYYAGVALTILCISVIFVWKSKRPASDRKVLKVRFDKIHNCPAMVVQTAKMLLREWPSAEGTYGDPERNFVRTSSLYESSDKLPCHLIATREISDGQVEVLSHAVIQKNTNFLAADRNKYINMLQKGVPLSSVKMSAEFAGIETTFLNNIDITNLSLKKANSSRESAPYEACLSSLLVKPQYRGNGLGKAMCGYAVQVSHELGIKRLLGGCVNGLVPFYQKMGVSRMEGIKRKDMPSVRLGNEMYLDLSPVVIQKAASFVLRFKH